MQKSLDSLLHLVPSCNVTCVWTYKVVLLEGCVRSEADQTNLTAILMAVPLHAKQAQRGHGCIAVPILNSDTRRGSVFNATL